MSGLREPGVLADHWPWGPPLAVVVVPRHLHPDGAVGDTTFVVTSDLKKDIGGRPYREVEEKWPTGQVIERDELPRLLAWAGVTGEQAARVVAQVDRILAVGG